MFPEKAQKLPAFGRTPAQDAPVCVKRSGGASTSREPGTSTASYASQVGYQNE